MRLFIIFIIFIAVEFILQTFVDVYKFHRVGLLQEFLPLIITTIVGGLIFKQTIADRPFWSTYLKLTSTSIAGLIVVRTILFVQWVWFIAPEYRHVPGDMSEGLGFTIVYLTFGTFVILISYLLVMLTIKSLTKKAARRLNNFS